MISFLYPAVSNLKELAPTIFFTWTARGVSYVFIITNLLSLIPSILILIAVLGFRNMYTVDNIIVTQIAVIDVLYALWTVTWVSLKLATNYEVLNETTCQIEAAISAICKVTWLYSALVCAFWRYYTIVKGGYISKTSSFLLQLSQWVLPILAGAFIAATHRFDVMPSGGYCYLAYHPNDPLVKIFYGVTILVIFIPTVLAVYFYYSITRQFYNIMKKVTENARSSENYLLEMSGDDSNYPKQLNEKQVEGRVSSYLPVKKELTESEKLAINPTLSKYRAVAFRSIMYCLIFILSFLPYGITMIVELIMDKSRTATIDFFVVSAVMLHKVLSPLVTLLINASILGQVRKLIGL